MIYEWIDQIEVIYKAVGFQAQWDAASSNCGLRLLVI